MSDIDYDIKVPEVVSEEVEAEKEVDDCPLIVDPPLSEVEQLQQSFDQSLIDSMEADAPDVHLPTTIDEEVEIDHLPKHQRSTRSRTNPNAPKLNYKTLKYAYAASVNEGVMYEDIIFEVKPKKQDVDTMNVEPVKQDVNTMDVEPVNQDVDTKDVELDTSMEDVDSTVEPAINFRENAPTASSKSFCTIMQLAALEDWIVKEIDVENAYLEAPIDKDIYMFLPLECFKRENGKPVKVKLLIIKISDLGEITRYIGDIA
jgi:hypothetical protein